jgi:hypothetical protein
VYVIDERNEHRLYMFNERCGLLVHLSFRLQVFHVKAWCFVRDSTKFDVMNGLLALHSRSEVNRGLR